MKVNLYSLLCWLQNLVKMERAITRKQSHNVVKAGCVCDVCNCSHRFLSTLLVLVDKTQCRGMFCVQERQAEGRFGNENINICILEY